MALLSAGLTLLPAVEADRGRAFAASSGDCAPGADWGTLRSDLAAQVGGLVNSHRAALGLSSLGESPALTAAAVWKARHMAKYGYLSHDDPAPPLQRSTGDRVAACGYTAEWGENLAAGFPSPGSALQAWLGSPGHRANIERSSFAAMGVGAATAANGTMYWAQVFGTSAGGAPPASVPPAAAPPPPPSAAPPPTPQRTPTSSVSHRQVRPARIEASPLLLWGPGPRADRLFTGRLTITGERTRERVMAGRVSCRARAAGRALWVEIHRLRNGFAVCRWRVPRGTRGSRMIGTIRVTAVGRHTARWFSRVVR